MQAGRDAKKDLVMCDLATPGPWFTTGSKWCSEVTTDLDSGPESWICQLWYKDDLSMENWLNNANFIAQAREALPYWIQRAMVAEAEVLRVVMLPGSRYEKLVVALRTIQEESTDDGARECAGTTLSELGL